MPPNKSTFQSLILSLQSFWAERGCVVLQPYDMEVGAGTFHPATTLRALGPEPWRCAYVQPSRRPTDGRYGENPNRLQHYYQFQVLLKPSPEDSQELYLQSLYHLGINPSVHDIRFVEDDWESPTLGAWGLGWEVWCDGMEVTQFTYFQQVGGIECRARLGRIDLRSGAAGDVHPGRRECLRPRLGRLRHHLRRRVQAKRSRRLGLQLRIRRHRAAVPPLRRRGGRVQGAAGARKRRWCCRPTSNASRRAIASTCWTRAASSA